jgi:hypothetical protein
MDGRARRNIDGDRANLEAGVTEELVRLRRRFPSAFIQSPDTLRGGNDVARVRQSAHARASIL